MLYDAYAFTPTALKRKGYSLAVFESELTDPYDVYVKEVGIFKGIGSVKYNYPDGTVFFEPKSGAFGSFDFRLTQTDTKSIGLEIAVPFIGAALKNKLLKSSEVHFGYGSAEEYAVDFTAMERFFKDNLPDEPSDLIVNAEDGDVLITVGIIRAKEFEMFALTETGQEIEFDIGFIKDNIKAGAGFTAKKIEGATYKVGFSSPDKSIPVALATRILIYNEHTKGFKLWHEPYKP